MSDHMGAKWLSEIDIEGMYDAPGFLKPWYFMLRLFEEITRSKRYGRPVTLMTVGVDARARASLENWLSTRLRASDLLCRDAVGRYFILLPETAEGNASDLGKRMLGDFSRASMGMATLPGEVDQFTELADLIAVDSRRKAA
jgi:hypothetical protein